MREKVQFWGIITLVSVILISSGIMLNRAGNANSEAANIYYDQSK